MQNKQCVLIVARRGSRVPKRLVARRDATRRDATPSPPPRSRLLFPARPLVLTRRLLVHVHGVVEERVRALRDEPRGRPRGGGIERRIARRRHRHRHRHPFAALRRRARELRGGRLRLRRRRRHPRAQRLHVRGVVRRRRRSRFSFSLLRRRRDERQDAPLPVLRSG
eukprot:31028-Pelagococcus_subviridis.AAC.1